jgi:hypothetical protein
MRSQGFDTYADFKDRLLLLYIVPARAELAHPEQGGLYWEQDYKTNVILDNALSAAADARRARRNAVAPPTEVTFGSLLAHLAVRTRVPPPAQGGTEGEEGAGAAEEEDVQVAEPAHPDIRELYRTAEAHLHFLLATNADAAYVYPPLQQKLLTSFPSVIETAITQVERYRVQLEG